MKFTKLATLIIVVLSCLAHSILGMKKFQPPQPIAVKIEPSKGDEKNISSAPKPKAGSSQPLQPSQIQSEPVHGEKQDTIIEEMIKIGRAKTSEDLIGNADADFRCAAFKFCSEFGRINTYISLYLFKMFKESPADDKMAKTFNETFSDERNTVFKISKTRWSVFFKVLEAQIGSLDNPLSKKVLDSIQEAAFAQTPEGKAQREKQINADFQKYANIGAKTFQTADKISKTGDGVGPLGNIGSTPDIAGAGTSVLFALVDAGKIILNDQLRKNMLKQMMSLSLKPEHKQANPSDWKCQGSSNRNPCEYFERRKKK